MADISSVTVSVVARTVFGNKRIVVADIVVGTGASDDWPAGGISVTPAQFGLDGIDYLIIEGGTLLYRYIHSTGVIQAYTASGSPGVTANLEVADGAVANETVRAMAIGWGG